MKIQLPLPRFGNLAKTLLLLLALALIGLHAADFTADRHLPELNDRLHAPSRKDARELPLIASANSTGAYGGQPAHHTPAEPGEAQGEAHGEAPGRHPFKSLGKLEPVLE